MQASSYTSVLIVLCSVVSGAPLERRTLGVEKMLLGTVSDIMGMSNNGNMNLKVGGSVPGFSVKLGADSDSGINGSIDGDMGMKGGFEVGLGGDSNGSSENGHSNTAYSNSDDGDYSDNEVVTTTKTTKKFVKPSKSASCRGNGCNDPEDVCESDPQSPGCNADSSTYSPSGLGSGKDPKSKKSKYYVNNFSKDSKPAGHAGMGMDMPKETEDVEDPSESLGSAELPGEDLEEPVESEGGIGSPEEDSYDPTESEGGIESPEEELYEPNESEGGIESPEEELYKPNESEGGIESPEEIPGEESYVPTESEGAIESPEDSSSPKKSYKVSKSPSGAGSVKPNKSAY